jgi:hypothetical protein
MDCWGIAVAKALLVPARVLIVKTLEEESSLVELSGSVPPSPLGMDIQAHHMDHSPSVSRLET